METRANPVVCQLRRHLLIALAPALLVALGPQTAAIGAIPCGIFVSATTGSDVPGAGLAIDSPCLSIPYALLRAQQEALTCIFVQAGTYAGPLTIVNGVEIHGGYDTAWVQDNWSQSGHATTLTGGYDATIGQYAAVVALNLTQPAVLGNLRVVAPDAVGSASGNGRSSYGVYVRNVGSLILDNCYVGGGAGAAGTPGSNGTSASQTPAPGGTAGQDGFEGSVACGTTYSNGGGGGVNGSAPGANGGAGGLGGSMDTSCSGLGACLECNARPGTFGANGQGSWYGSGGNGGNVCVDGFAGQNSNGTLDGAGGAGGDNAGQIVSFAWNARPGGAGSLGSHGSGGGGGGGGGGCDTGIDSRGGGGGGGGSGGARAAVAGQGGGGGGGSIGIFGLQSSLQVTNCVLDRGRGAFGAGGGSGGVGQFGGSGGPGGSNQTTDGGNGGAGGNGSRGGHSGGGGGGAGGSSFGICLQGSVLTQSGNTFTGGVYGAGGAGGFGPVSGSPGADGQLLGITTSAKSTVVTADGDRFRKNLCDPIHCPLSDAGDEGVPRRVALLANVPNPFNPRTEIFFELPIAGPVVVEIHDLKGRLVRRLVDGRIFPAGRSGVVWDGRDERRRAIASGTYLVSLQVGEQTQLRKIMLLR